MTVRQAPFAAIFDWDGVIVDSASLHERSWVKLAQEIGQQLQPGAFLRGFGMKSAHIIRDIHGWSDDPREIEKLTLRKEELYRELAQASSMVALPGAKAWLQRLNSAGVPCVVASSTHRLNIEVILEVIGLAGAFAAIVSAEDVDHGKPHPDVFLKAAAKAGAAPQQCVVFEDAHVGIEAARRAGMRVIAVTTTHRREELTGADLVIDRLDELTLDTVAGLITPA